jgi:hypothetical protein
MEGGDMISRGLFGMPPPRQDKGLARERAKEKERKRARSRVTRTETLKHKRPLSLEG